VTGSLRYPGRNNRSLREAPQDLNPFRDRLSSGLVHADEDSRVLGWINRDTRAESCRSSVLHNHRVQVRVAPAHIVHPSHRLLVAVRHRVDRLLRQLHRRDQFSGNRFAIHFGMAEIGLAKADHVLCRRAQTAGSVPGEDRPARRILACAVMSLCQALLLFRRGPQRRVGHAQRLENLGIHLIFPGFAGRGRDQITRPDSGVGVPIERRQLGRRFVARSPSEKVVNSVVLDASPFEQARQVGRIVWHSRGEVRQLQRCQLLCPERVAFGHVFLSGSVRDDLVAVPRGISAWSLAAPGGTPA
jgi:hypothetical protein